MARGDDLASIIANVREDLERLVRIPSISLNPESEAPLRHAAQATAEILERAGLPEVELLEVPGGPPAVFGSLSAPAGAPTVLLYAHYDVQPPGPIEEWTSDPFEPVERDGRLYGRGTADNKCGVAMAAALLRAFDDRPPVGVKVIVEGDEDSGRGSFASVLDSHKERLAADVIVVADAANWRSGQPTLYTSVRGGVILDVQVQTLRTPVHNGMFGGPVPDALMALMRMLSSLQDRAGAVAVRGLGSERWVGEPLDEFWVRAGSGMLDGVRLIGRGPLAERVYSGPSINAIGLDAPSVEGASNVLVPVARARLCVRLAPQDDPAVAADAIESHLRRVAPWGVLVEVRALHLARGIRLSQGSVAEHAARKALGEAYGKSPIMIGAGAGNPLIAAFAEMLPAAQFVLWGAADDASRIHSSDESIALADLGCATIAQIRFVEQLAAGARDPN